jgi:hypothetical protein
MASLHPWWSAYIRRGAIQRGLDPAAVLAVASMEGLSGGVGDNGHAFGPFQENDAGGVLTNRPGNHRQFAESRKGIDFALDAMVPLAKGLKGEHAINAIVTHFERPANPGKEIAGATARLGEFGHFVRTPDAQVAGVAGGELGSLAPGMDTAGQIHDSALQSLRDIAGGQDAVKSFGGVSQLIQALHSQVPQIEGAQLQPAQGGGVTTGDPSIDAKAVALVKKYLGVKYTWGGTNAGTGFDCSGLLQNVWKSLNVSIPRTTYDQWGYGKAIQQPELRPGDAVFFTGADPMNGKPGHVGMYVGGGRFIEAPGTGMKVRISSLAGRSDYMGARRFG